MTIEYASTLELDENTKPRPSGPFAVICNPAFRRNLEALNYNPWDVIAGPEMAKAGNFSPRKMPDWRRSVTAVYLPDPEHKRLFPGPADYYRMDVLFDWIACCGARETDRSMLWIYAADYLAKHKLGRPNNAWEVEDLLHWLWRSGILLPRVMPLKRPYHPYCDLAN
ncbi:hypothetical protein [Brevundimonas sp. TWP3-1-2b1]|uniref:hypothetical protein n=1 Tax=Brevundimonas sp. TWP3-1-2b1 TaxID=2804650 RepID=UPI003CF2777B